jgi:hypothetical protein
MSSQYNEIGQNKYYKQKYPTISEMNNYTCKNFCSCRNSQTEYLTNYSVLTGKGYYNPINNEIIKKYT